MKEIYTFFYRCNQLLLEKMASPSCRIRRQAHVKAQNRAARDETRQQDPSATNRQDLWTSIIVLHIVLGQQGVDLIDLLVVINITFQTWQMRGASTKQAQAKSNRKQAEIPCYGTSLRAEMQVHHSNLSGRGYGSWRNMYAGEIKHVLLVKAVQQRACNQTISYNELITSCKSYLPEQKRRREDPQKLRKLRQA